MEKVINIIGRIGIDYTYANFIADTLELSEGDNIVINVDSPGGDVDEGFSIANKILSLSNSYSIKTSAKRVYSIATIIYLAAPYRVANCTGSEFMIHNAWTAKAKGNANDLTETVEALKAIDNDMKSFYAERTSLPLNVLADLMSKETFFEANTALRYGFATHLNDCEVEIDEGEERLKAVAMYKVVGQTFNDYPQEATDAARRVLKFRDENKDIDCLTRTGWVRANQLANREPISVDVISRMSSFQRFLQYKDESYRDEDGGVNCGRIALDAWGGEIGVKWAERKLAELEAQGFKNKITNLLNKIENVMDKKTLIGAIKEAFGLSTTEALEAKAEAMDEETQAEAMEDGEEKEEEKVMLTSEEMATISNMVMEMLMEKLGPELESMKEENLALKAEAKKADEARTAKIVALVEKIETSYEVPTETFQTKAEKVTTENDEDPFTILRKMASKN